MFRKLLAAMIAVSVVAAVTLDTHAGKKRGKRGRNPNPGVVPVHAHAFGTTYADLALRWAQWSLEVPAAVNPILDETGENAAEGQSGKVWFLAGNFGGETTRVINVPEGKALFFPILVYSAWAPVDGETEEEVRATADFFMDPELISVLECSVDGVDLQDLYSYRVESPVGSIGPNDMAYGDPTADPPIPDAYDGSDIVLADGYWLLLRPLGEGDHVIHFHGVLGPGEEVWFELDVTYLITVMDDDGDDDDTVWPIDSTPYGKAYGEWSGLWWQWALSIPADQNPMLDETGEYAGINQSGPVWFLAGTQGGTAERTVTVPEGKALFFPLVNYVWVNAPAYGDPPWSPEQEAYARGLIGGFMDEATGLACEIDGQPVENLEAYRCQTPPGKDYMVDFPEGNVWGISAGTYGPSVDDGIYLMLKPLDEGDHIIHFHGAAGPPDDPEFELDVTYNLSIVDDDDDDDHGHGCGHGHSHDHGHGHGHGHGH